MTKLHLNARVQHLLQWYKTISFILNNRGRSTYGANELKRIVERYLTENSTTIENLKAAEQALIEMSDLLRVTGIKGLRRIGARNDGGYIGVEPTITPTLISGGGGKNIDFEFELAELGSQIHLYDPTIKKLPKTHKNITHRKIALTAPGNKTFKKSVTLKEAVEALSTDDHAPLWLKLDIEGSEIDLLANDLSLLTKFEQVFIEFHDSYRVAEPIFRRHLIDILKKLNETHYVISAVSNNWQSFSNYGYAFAPVTFEVTFLSKEIDIEPSHANDYAKHKSVNNKNRLEIPDAPFEVTKQRRN